MTDMPRYYFDLIDAGGITRDEGGLILRDTDAAQLEAARALGEMAKEAALHLNGRDTQEMAIDVRDDFGPVMHVRFSFDIERKN